MTVRKNFLFDEQTARHLEKIAQVENLTQSDVVRNLIEKRYEDISKAEKLQAFHSIIPFPSGSLIGQSIQSIKAEMDV
jgi:endonuclease III-like uncharacterized protein